MHPSRLAFAILLAAASAVHASLVPRLLPVPKPVFTGSTRGINNDSLTNCTNCTNLGNFHNPLPVDTSVDPIVSTRNGPYAGVRFKGLNASETLSGFGVSNGAQDLFLGIPYAAQPTGSRRFARPHPYNETWDEKTPRSAKRYSEFCFSTGIDNDYTPPFLTYKLGEECLTLNVVRPAGVAEDAKLPIWVWIHGGAFSYGGSGDRRFNASFIVDQSVQDKQPLIFASINYRTGILGFPVGSEASAAGIQNLGLYDQRLALNWIKDNIASFGGDPDKITLVGESAGGASVLFHMTAYGGRQDELFRSAVVQSGYWATPARSQNRTDTNDQAWNALINATGCNAASSSSSNNSSRIDCLRKLPLAKLRSAIPEMKGLDANFNPMIDGELVKQDMQAAFLAGNFVNDTPLLICANQDEGVSFGRFGLNTSAEVIESLIDANAFPDGAFGQSEQAALLKAYPDDEDLGVPFRAGDGAFLSVGTMNRRSGAIWGDVQMIAPRRQVAQVISNGTAPVYAAQFSQSTYRLPISAGTPHYVEVASVFYNPLLTQNPLGSKPRDVALANEMNAYWRSFVVHQDPNIGRLQGAAEWPAYNMAKDGQDQQQPIFLDLIKSVKWGNSTARPDDFRQEGIRLINEIRAK